MTLDQQQQINEIPHAAVCGFAGPGVRVELFRPMLFDRQRWHGHRRYTGEAEPVFSRDLLQWLEDFVANTKVNVEPGKGSTIEPRIHWKASPTLRRLIQLGHRLSDYEGKEIW